MISPNWPRFLEEHVDELESIFNVSLGDLIACGGVGCVFEADSNVVLKITEDRGEAATWEAIYEMQQRGSPLYGFASVIMPPIKIVLPRQISRKPLYGIVREALDDVCYCEIDRHVEIIDALIKVMHTPIKRFFDRLWEVAENFPEETDSFISSIFYLHEERQLLVWDLCCHNFGSRSADRRQWIFRDPGAARGVDKKWDATKIVVIE